MRRCRLVVIAVFHPFQLTNFIQFELYDDCEERIKVKGVSSLDCSKMLGADVIELTYFPVIVDLQGQSL